MSVFLYYKAPLGGVQNITVLENLSWVRARNTIGDLRLAIPKSLYDLDTFVVDGTFELWRTVGNTTYLEGDTLWYLRDTEESISEIGEEYILVAYDALELLKRRIVAYYAGTVYSDKINFTDDMMKNVVKENFGALSIDAARDISDVLTVAGSTSQGVIIEKEIAWTNVLDSIQDMADAAEAEGQRILFDIVYTGQVLEFRTYIDLRGNDLTGQRILSTEGGNLGRVSVKNDRFEEANYIYALGDAAGGIRPYVEVSNAGLIDDSPLNRREFADSAGDATDETSLTIDGERMLYENRPRVILDGKIVDTYGFLYGVDYKYGDKLTVLVGGVYRDVYVDAVNGVVDQLSGEKIDVILQAEY